MTLTRSSLDRMTANLHERARANLARDGYVAEALLGLNVRGEQVLRALAGAAAGDPHEVAEAEAAGIFMAPASLPLAGDQLEELFRERGVVAAITFGEIWSLDAPGAPLPRPGESIAEHPERTESIYTASAWPRVSARRLLASQIVRDTQGRPGTPGRPADLTARPASAHMLWFAERLPR